MKAMRLTMKTTTKKAESRGAEPEAIARMRRINGVKGAPSEGGSMEVVHIGNIAQFTCRERLRQMLEKKGITWLKWRFIDENVQIHESQEGEGINLRSTYEINRKIAYVSLRACWIKNPMFHYLKLRLRGLAVYRSALRAQ